MKTMCPPGYLQNGFVATHALGHMIPNSMSCHKTIVMITKTTNRFHDYIYIIMPILLL